MLISDDQVMRTEIFTIANEVALDESTDTWAGEYQGYNLDELVQNVNESVAKVDAMEQDVTELKSGLQDIGNELIDVPKALTPDETDADLYISDSNGNVLAKFERGNIATQNFNSEDVPEVRDTSVQSGVFDLADTSGNVVARFENGHIKTKEFNSAEVGSAIPSIGVKGEKALSLHNAFSNCYIYHHMNVEVSNPYIPSESLYDIRFAKSLGFDMIEANTHKCSDGVFLVKHGANSGGLGNGLKDAIGSADYSAVKWEEVTSTWIRENVRYNARLPKYCGYIPTLDEFCKECRRFNMKVKVSSLEAAIVARKYLPDEMIWATLWNPLEGRGDFRGTVEYVWYRNANIDNAINVCKNIGAPLNIVVSGLLSNREDSELSEMIEKAHNNGFTVGIVYPTSSDIMRAANLGIDCAGSTNRTVNLLEYGVAKHIVNLSDTALVLSNGAVYDPTTDIISMTTGATVHCDGNIISGIGSLVVRYSGELTITVGATGAEYELIDYQSDGESYVMLSNVLSHRFDGSNWTKWFNILASADTVIYELTFDGAYIS
jgi:hypothetical protein